MSDFLALVRISAFSRRLYSVDLIFLSKKIVQGIVLLLGLRIQDHMIIRSSSART